MDFWTKLAHFSLIETERLYLRPLQYADLSDFYQMLSEDRGLPYVFPTPLDTSEAAYVLTHAFLKEPLGVWGICLKDHPSLIGIIRFEHLDLKQSKAELSYFLNRNMWGKGLMTEAVKTLSDLSLEELGLKRVLIITHDSNRASQRVALKSGFILAKQFKGSDRYSHKMQNYLQFELTREKRENNDYTEIAT